MYKYPESGNFVVAIYLDDWPSIEIFDQDGNPYNESDSLYQTQLELPNLRKIMQNGVYFRHMDAAVAKCLPSRVSMMQGVYPPQTGVWVNSQWDYYKEDPNRGMFADMSTSWCNVAREHGWLVYGVGKLYHDKTPTYEEWSKTYNQYEGVFSPQAVSVSYSSHVGSLSSYAGQTLRHVACTPQKVSDSDDPETEGRDDFYHHTYVKIKISNDGTTVSSIEPDTPPDVEPNNIFIDYQMFGQINVRDEIKNLNDEHPLRIEGKKYGNNYEWDSIWMSYDSYLTFFNTGPYKEYYGIAFNAEDQPYSAVDDAIADGFINVLDAARADDTTAKAVFAVGLKGPHEANLVRGEFLDKHQYDDIVLPTWDVDYSDPGYDWILRYVSASTAAKNKTTGARPYTHLSPGAGKPTQGRAIRHDPAARRLWIAKQDLDGTSWNWNYDRNNSLIHVSQGGTNPARYVTYETHQKSVKGEDGDYWYLTEYDAIYDATPPANNSSCSVFGDNSGDGNSYDPQTGILHTGDDAPTKVRLRYFLGMMEECDDAIGKIYDKLEADGMLDRTTFVIWSDHGYMHGDRAGIDDVQNGAMGKDLPYGPPARCFFMVSTPNSPKKKIVEEPVSAIDIAPTLLDLMGLPIPDSYQGQTLVPAIMNPDTWRNDKCPLVFRLGNFGASMRIDGQVYRLIHWFNGVRELFNETVDPFNQVNLMSRDEGTPSATGIVTAIIEQTLHTMREIGAATHRHTEINDLSANNVFFQYAASTAYMTMEGGKGNDTYFISNEVNGSATVDITVTENPGEGTDTIWLLPKEGNTNLVTSYTIPNNVEVFRVDGNYTNAQDNAGLEITASDTAVRVYLSGSDDKFTGSDGDDYVSTGKGADTVLLSKGNDVVELGGNENTIEFGDYGGGTWVVSGIMSDNDPTVRVYAASNHTGLANMSALILASQDVTSPDPVTGESVHVGLRIAGNNGNLLLLKAKKSDIETPGSPGYNWFTFV